MAPRTNTIAREWPDLAKELVNPFLADKLTTGSKQAPEWRCSKGHVYSAQVYARNPERQYPVGCPYCSNRKVLPGFNDLATTEPQLAAELVNPSDALTVTRGSKKKLQWRCPEYGHVYTATPNGRSRPNNPTGCPYCAGKKVLPGFNDLATTHPNVAEFCADPEDAHRYSFASNKAIEWCRDGETWTQPIAQFVNSNQTPPSRRAHQPHLGQNDLGTFYPDIADELADQSLRHKLTVQSNKKVEWVCSICGQHWTATVQDRTLSDSGCPYCSGRKAIPGVTDLATLRPDVASQLANPEEAKHLTVSSHNRVLWRCEKGHEWYALVYNRTKENPTGCPNCAHSGVSQIETEFADTVQLLIGNTTMLRNDKQLLQIRKELDIVIPDKKIAIEFNGVVWHSEMYRDNHIIHNEKRIAAEAQGYQLIQIWSDDWEHHRDSVLTLLAHKLGAIGNLCLVCNDIPEPYPHIGARKLTPTMLDPTAARKFLAKHHIQGPVAATTHYGLIDDDKQIRAVLSVRSSKSNARMHREIGDWEIQRYATYGSIPGGFSRLLAFAERDIKNQKLELSRWISFSANDISTGAMYRACGFVLDKELAPDYRYAGKFTGWQRKPKERFQRKRFREDPNLVFDESWTEHEAALRNKLYRCYDSGKKRWIKQV